MWPHGASCLPSTPPTTHTHTPSPSEITSPWAERSHRLCLSVWTGVSHGDGCERWGLRGQPWQTRDVLFNYSQTHAIQRPNTCPVQTKQRLKLMKNLLYHQHQWQCCMERVLNSLTAVSISLQVCCCYVSRCILGKPWSMCRANILFSWAPARHQRSEYSVCSAASAKELFIRSEFVQVHELKFAVSLCDLGVVSHFSCNSADIYLSFTYSFFFQWSRHLKLSLRKEWKSCV